MCLVLHWLAICGLLAVCRLLAVCLLAVCLLAVCLLAVAWLLAAVRVGSACLLSLLPEAVCTALAIGLALAEARVDRCGLTKGASALVLSVCLSIPPNQSIQSICICTAASAGIKFAARTVAEDLELV